MINFQKRLNELPHHQQQWTTALLDFIYQAEGQTDLSVTGLSRQFLISERQFYRRVKQNLGISPNQLIRCIKMQKAKDFLEQGTHATIAELAYDLGYSYPEYFSNLFNETYGKRPSQFLR